MANKLFIFLYIYFFAYLFVYTFLLIVGRCVFGIKAR